MSAHSSLGYPSLLSSAWLGNPERLPVRAFRRAGPGTRTGGDVVPAPWVEFALGERLFVVRGTPGGRTRRTDGGERVSDRIGLRLPESVVVRTTEDVGQVDADVVRWDGHVWRASKAMTDSYEIGFTYVTMNLVEPGNVPEDLPA